MQLDATGYLSRPLHKFIPRTPVPMLLGPCAAAVASGGHQVHSALSGARLWVDTNKQMAVHASTCRRAGGWYFWAKSRSQKLGGCLPTKCTATTEADLLIAVEALLGISVESVFSFTALEPVTTLGPVTNGDRQQRVPDEIGGHTEWFSMSLPDLISRPLPTRLATAGTLAITFREFRGSMQQYLHLTLSAASYMSSWGKQGATLLIAGMTPWAVELVGMLKIRSVIGVPFCGAVNWQSINLDATLGIELVVPPMWQLLVPDDLPWQVRSNVDLGGSHLINVCRVSSLSVNLQWVVPHDALLAATVLAARGPCAAAVATALPELASASAFVASNETVPWPAVAAKALTCTERLEGAFWEFRLDGSDWPALRRASHFEQLGGPEAQLHAFVCAPSWFHLDAGLWEFAGVPAEETCTVEGVAREALPLLLAFHTGRFEYLGGLEPPHSYVYSGGRRAPRDTHWQISTYHAKAVSYRREREVLPIIIPKRRLSAAVCIVGMARTLSFPDVYQSIVENATGSALGADASVFFVLDLEDRSIADFNNVFRAIPPAAVAVINGTSWGQLPACKSFDRCGPACVQQFHKLLTCLHLVKATEATRGQQFDWMIRLRPDAQWLAPVGDLDRLDTNGVHVVVRQSGIKDPEDNFALVPRQYADAYFGIGETCPSDDEVRSTRCIFPLRDGGHIYPECALKTRLEKMSVRLIPFPRIYRIRRNKGCQQTDPMLGLAKNARCGTGIG